MKPAAAARAYAIARKKPQIDGVQVWIGIGGAGLGGRVFEQATWGDRTRRLYSSTTLMSHNANRFSTREQVIAALSQVIGLPLTAAWRAADMRMFHFGKLEPADRGSVGEFALHVQCPWRIDGPDGIVTGRLDLWETVEDDPNLRHEAWDYEKSPNLQDFRLDQWLARNGSSPVVESVDADEFGGGIIAFAHGFVLRLFPAGTRAEDWRLLGPRIDAPHFVIIGGTVEPDDEPGV